MKRLLPFAPLLLLAALLLSPAAALSGAKRGLEIWWGRVFLALLPCFVCVRLAERLGLLRGAARRPGGQLAAVAGFSLVSGAPNGAKLLYALVKDGSLTSQEGERLLPLFNGVSPAFLLSIIASELLKNKALFLPMAGAFYGSILCLLLPRLLQKSAVPAARPPSAATPFSRALTDAIESSMLDMLRIGGCILFISTLLSLVPESLLCKGGYAALSGLMEVSIGASAVAELELPLRLKTSLLAGLSAFGGLSLGLQTLCCYPGLRLLPYLWRKLALGLLTGAICYGLFPLFPSVSQAFASRQEVLARGLSLSALLLSSVLSAAFMAVLSLMVSSRMRD